MILIGPALGRCILRVRREGVLAAVGRDLALEVADFQLRFDIEEGRAVGVFQTDSLHVLGELVGDQIDCDQVSTSDRKTIELLVRDDVLRARRHPEAVFEVDGLAFDALAEAVPGTLNLCGVARTLVLRSQLDGGQWRGKVTVHQPDFGIAPFRSLMGALRVQADVEVEITVEADALSGIRAA